MCRSIVELKIYKHVYIHRKGVCVCVCSKGIDSEGLVFSLDFTVAILVVDDELQSRTKSVMKLCLFRA